METTHVFSSLHLTPENAIHVRKVEPKYAQIKNIKLIFLIKLKKLPLEMGAEFYSYQQGHLTFIKTIIFC